METSLYGQNNHQQSFSNQSSGFKGFPKVLSFDMNKIENRLTGFELKPPSSAAFQSQQMFRQKNQQSELVKSTLKYDVPFANIKKTIIEKQILSTKQPLQNLPPPSSLVNKQESQLKIPQQVKNPVKVPHSLIQEKQQPQPVIQPRITENKFLPESSRSTKIMHDFRKSSYKATEAILEKNKVSLMQKQPDKPLKPKLLEPILENETAQVSHLPPKSRSVMDPDNNILFLDNGSRIVNPINVRTPPPPFWGEEIEEDFYDENEEFYDHDKAMKEQEQRNTIQSKPKSTGGKKLKKKVIYVYESDSDEEGQPKQTNDVSPYLQQQPLGSIPEQTQNKSFQRIGLGIISKRQQSLENPSSRFNNNPQPYIGLMSNLNKNTDYGGGFSSKIVVQSGKKSTGALSSMPQSRQIRTGGFSMLPRIATKN